MGKTKNTALLYLTVSCVSRFFGGLSHGYVKFKYFSYDNGEKIRLEILVHHESDFVLDLYIIYISIYPSFNLVKRWGRQ